MRVAFHLFITTEKKYIASLFFDKKKKNHRFASTFTHYDCTCRSCLDITVAGSPSPAASEDEDEGCTTGNTASNHAGNHRSNHGSTKKGRQKRGVLPKQATSIMRTWLFQHLVVSIRSRIHTLWSSFPIFVRSAYDLLMHVASLPNRGREASNRQSDELNATASEQLVYQCSPTDPSTHVGRCWSGRGIARRKTP